MQRWKKKFPAPGIELDILEKEHADIHRQYIELDDAILHGQGSARIVEAARTLVQYMLLYFAHEEQFRRQLSYSVREDERNAWKKKLAEVLQIEAGLKQEEVYAALRMRGFCKSWMQEQRRGAAAGLQVTALQGTQDSERQLTTSHMS